MFTLQMGVQIACAVFTVIAAILGYFIKNTLQTVKKLSEDLSASRVETVNALLAHKVEASSALALHKEDVAKNYVPKNDYRDDMRRVFDLLEKMNDKLDGKVDRHGG